MFNPIIYSHYLWAVGSVRNDPSKIYEDENGQALVFTDKAVAEREAEKLRVRGFPALVWPLTLISVPEDSSEQNQGTNQ